ncbi:MAG: hypothetical protein PHP39_10525, partial [Oscillospiraceae bacterium]|nr:hypothetical protein [Oscillospiraceae bacterium]
MSGSINGGSGTDLLDFSAYTTGVVVDLALGQLTANDLTAEVTGIENITGGSGDDNLIGDDNDNILIGMGGADTLVGGAGNDTYIFAAGWGTDDAITDSAGDDTVTFAVLTTGLSINLDDLGWTVTDGTNILRLNGQTIETLIAGSGHDIFTISGSAQGIIWGGGGNDIFRFVGNGSLSGSINGGDGTNSLDYSGYTAGGVTISLADTIGSGTATALSGTFTGVTVFTGSPAADTLIGSDNATAFKITGENTISVNGLSFAGFESLSGGAANDSFDLGAGGALSGSISGGAGEDSLTYEDYGQAVQITLTGADASGFSGQGSGLGAGFSGIDILQGSAQNDAFTGINETATFELGSSEAGSPDNLDSYTVTVDETEYTLSFSGFENLTGGNQADTFILNGQVNYRLSGGEGDDIFRFCDQATLQNSVDGGAGNDTLDLSLYTTGLNVALQALGEIDGFNGNLALVSGGFQNIDTLLGSVAEDTLTGLNSDATFELGTGTYTSGHTLSFSGFETLRGGSGRDTFILQDTEEFAGVLDGGSGIDTLDYSGYSADVTVNLEAGDATGVNGGLENSISGFEKVLGSTTHSNNLTGDQHDNILIGGDGDDTLTGGGGNDTLEGGAGDDTLAGEAGDDTLAGGTGNDNLFGGQGNDTYLLADNWGADTITENAGEGNDTLDASDITAALTFRFDADGCTITDSEGNQVSAGVNLESFSGGQNNDTFSFENGAAFNGRIDGESGDDTLDFSGYDQGISVILTGLGSGDGFAGTEAGLQFSFDNMNVLVASPQEDTLQGLDSDATWNLESAGATYTAGGRSLSFSAVENLLGGAANDTFSLADGAGHAGSIQGGSGIDHLDYSAYPVAVQVNLAEGTATAITGTIAGIENVTGGSGDDELTGDEGDNILTGGSGNDTLSGGSGQDTYLFADGWGEDIIVAIPGIGRAILDFSSVQADLTINLEEGAIQITDGVNTLTQPSGTVETIKAGSGNDSFYLLANYTTGLYGGAGNDTFLLADGVAYDGLLDGGTGNDTLSFSDCNNSVNVILTGHGSEDGFRGIESSLQAGFTNLDEVIGSKAADDVLTGRNTAATFILDDICSYSSAGRAISFSGFGVLQGGSGNDVFEIHGERAFILFGGAGDDTFVFCDGATLEGSIDGQAGRNTLDFADYTTSRNFTLTGIGGNNFTGKEAALSGEFKNIINLVGGQDIDALAGLNAPAVWELTGNGGVYAAENRQLEFNGIETVIGGADQDSFVVGSDAARKGNI